MTITGESTSGYEKVFPSINSPSTIGGTDPINCWPLLPVGEDLLDNPYAKRNIKAAINTPAAEMTTIRFTFERFSI